MKIFEIKTEKRLYWVSQSNPDGMYHAYFQPLHPRTGHPWQASRYISSGEDCWVGYNWRNGTRSPLQMGKPPAFEVWTKEWTGLGTGYSTMEGARQAVFAEQRRSKK